MLTDPRAMSAGAACVKVPTRDGLVMSGFGNREGTSSGTLDPVTVRALAVVAGGVGTLLVTVDVVALEFDDTTMLRREIAARTGVLEDGIVLAATHTHSAPAAMPKRVTMGAVDPEFWDSLRHAIFTACTEAMDSVVPARLRMGTGAETTVACNRRIPGGLIDPTVSVIRVDPENVADAPLAILVSYACHPVALGPRNLAISGDYPATVRTDIEAVYPGSIALFATGCAGQLNTGHRDRTVLEAMRLGHCVAGTALSVAGQIAAPAGAPLVVGPTTDSEAPQVAAATVPVTLPLQPTDVPSNLPSVMASVTVLRWGGMHVVALPGEPFCEIGIEIREVAATLGLTTVTLGYANGVPGYLPYPDAYASGGYEVCQAHRYYGQPSAFAPDASKAVVRAAGEALNMVRLTGSKQ